MLMTPRSRQSRKCSLRCAIALNVCLLVVVAILVVTTWYINSEQISQQTHYLSHFLPSTTFFKHNLEFISVSLDNNESSSQSSRPPLNTHMLARFFDKQILGYPTRIGVLGGSISTVPSCFIPKQEMHYTHLFVEFLNQHFPVPQNASDREAAGIESSNTRMKHELVPMAAGGMLSATASFCWKEIFHNNPSKEGYDPLAEPDMPDLMLIDYAVNDAFSTTDAMSFGDGVPLRSDDSMDRLTRSLLSKSEELHKKKVQEAIEKHLKFEQNIEEHNFSQSTEAIAMSHRKRHRTLLELAQDSSKHDRLFENLNELRSSSLTSVLSGTALFYIFFVAQQPIGSYVSRQDSHQRLADMYSVPYVSSRDYFLSPLHDPIMYPKDRPFSTLSYIFGYGEKKESELDGIHPNEAGYRLMFRLLEIEIKNLMNHYIDSQRTRFESSRMSNQPLERYLSNQLHREYRNKPWIRNPWFDQTVHSESMGHASDEAREEAEMINKERNLLHIRKQEIRNLITKEVEEIMNEKLVKEKKRIKVQLATKLSESNEVINFESANTFSSNPSSIDTTSHVSLLHMTPLPLPHAWHPFNSDSSNFNCRALYYPYAAGPESRIDLTPWTIFAPWFGIIENRDNKFEWKTHKAGVPKDGIIPQPLWMLEEQKRLESSSSNTNTVETLSVSDDDILVGSHRFSSHIFRAYPKIVIRIPPVQHLAVLFYQRTWKHAGSAVVWLTCEDDDNLLDPTIHMNETTTTPKLGSRVIYGESSKIFLNATWSSPSTQAAAAILFPPEDSFINSTTNIHWKPLQPPCSFNRIHIQLVTPYEFMVIGHAES